MFHADEKTDRQTDGKEKERQMDMQTEAQRN
jgi:hypothetical protein